MTLDQLREIVTARKEKTEALRVASQALHSFVEEADLFLNSSMSGAIDVDEFVILNSPIYAQLKTEAQTASSQLL